MKRRIYRDKLIGAVGISMAILAASSLTACADKVADDNSVQSLQTKNPTKIETHKNDKQKLREDGIEYIRMGRYAEATDTFIEALGCSNGFVSDEDIDVAYYLGLAQYNNKAFEDAIQTYSSVIDLREDESKAYFLRGKLLLEKGNKQEAIADFEKCIETGDDSDYDNYIWICEELCKAGYEKEGNEYIERALNSKKHMSDYQKGVFMYYLGSFTEARGFLEEARGSGDDLPVILYLGRTYEALDDVSYAISLYESALSQNHDSGALYAQLGLARMKQKDYEGALNAFETGISIGDEASMQSLLFNRVVANEYLGNFETAKGQMSEYLSKYPNDETAIRENKFLSTR